MNENNHIPEYSKIIKQLQTQMNQVTSTHILQISKQMNQASSANMLRISKHMNQMAYAPMLRISKQMNQLSSTQILRISEQMKKILFMPTIKFDANTLEQLQKSINQFQKAVDFSSIQSAMQPLCKSMMLMSKNIKENDLSDSISSLGDSIESIDTRSDTECVLSDPTPSEIAANINIMTDTLVNVLETNESTDFTASEDILNEVQTTLIEVNQEKPTSLHVFASIALFVCIISTFAPILGIDLQSITTKLNALISSFNLYLSTKKSK